MARPHTSPNPSLDKYFTIIEEEMSCIMSGRASFDFSFEKSFEDKIMQRAMLWSAERISDALSNIPKKYIPGYVDYELVSQFKATYFFTYEGINYSSIKIFYEDNALHLSYWAHQFLEYDFI